MNLISKKKQTINGLLEGERGKKAQFTLRGNTFEGREKETELLKLTRKRIWNHSGPKR